MSVNVSDYIHKTCPERNLTYDVRCTQQRGHDGFHQSFAEGYGPIGWPRVEDFEDAS